MPFGRSVYVHDEGGREARRDERALAVPTGPQRERRLADAAGCAGRAARIALGEIRDTTYQQLGKVHAGRAGARVREMSVTSNDATRLPAWPLQRNGSER